MPPILDSISIKASKAEELKSVAVMRKSKARELLKRLNCDDSRDEDIDKAIKYAPPRTVLYCDEWRLPKYKYIPKFPAPPSDATDGDCYYFYGFATTFKKLEQIYHEHQDEASKKTSLVAGIGLFILKDRLVGYPDLYLVNAEVDESAKPEEIVEFDGRKMLRILAVACTKSRELFYRRPSLKQMRLLGKYLGCKPRWFKDIVPKDEFEGWDIECELLSRVQ
ncbi:uncharacterized protein EV420DRAFT_1658184 [Desarmillaria tabescens]|uniref:Uncharacterized protein n=1 Tax=Armillaria tabescens TaxID=1929756 RepID=A0AA39NP32_ARMTA|nr:uncharacterized protein EV420DRAFT_1658184 [Desarmillaria tabescens]KAK0469039.1 hypothetical protein EV420DRAFT_1658184 [Desarmillaria tabescens]